MPATALLSDIVDALEVQIDEYSSFLNLDSGEVECVSVEFLRKAQDEGEASELLEWQEGEWKTAKQIASSDRFVALPSKYDVHEWNIMQEFCHSLDSGKVREDLLRAIHGSAAFRSFKEGVRRHRIESAWFDFRAEALKQIAIEWCKENGIAWR